MGSIKVLQVTERQGVGLDGGSGPASGVPDFGGLCCLRVLTIDGMGCG